MTVLGYKTLPLCNIVEPTSLITVNQESHNRLLRWCKKVAKLNKITKNQKFNEENYLILMNSINPFIFEDRILHKIHKVMIFS